MQKQEFEERIERTVTDEQYKVIEEVYMWHPSIRNTSGKDEVAELYKSFGMTIFHDMLPRAKKAHELDELLRNAQREVQRIQEEIEELSCPTLRVSSLGVKDLKAVEDAAKSFSNTWAGTSKADFITASYDIKSGIASLTDEGVAQFTQLAALTGKATKSTTEEMGSLFATGYGIYKGFYDDMSDLEFGEMFSAGIATAVKNYKTSGSEMASAISALGATATNANVPLEEQLAIMGQLQTTMSGSEAATKY